MPLRQHEQREMNAIQQQQLEYESSRIKYWDLPEISHHQTTYVQIRLAFIQNN